jgi:2-keto-3-deoxy-L-rhamnonate aldolase RhmA
MAAENGSRKPENGYPCDAQDDDYDEYRPLIGGPGFPILKVNPVKAKLKRGDIVIAGTINLPCLDTAVAMASSFDFLWIEAEHSAITLEKTHEMILATRGMRAVPFVRLPWQEMWMAKRVMDIGAIGVVFPFCSSPERAKTCSMACRYPPLGRRGCGPTMSQLAWGLDESQYYDWAQDNICCVVMIEEKEAIDCLDDIAKTPGIDCLFIGTSDLALSFTGDKRKTLEEPVYSACDKVVAAGKKYGLPVGCPAGSPEQMKALISRGFTFFQCPPDIGFLQKGINAFTSSLTEAGIFKRQKSGGVATNPSGGQVC